VHSYLFDTLARARIQEHHEAAARLRLAASSRRPSPEPAAEASPRWAAGRLQARLQSSAPFASPWSALGNH
jgi:hypothetical protein